MSTKSKVLRLIFSPVVIFGFAVTVFIAWVIIMIVVAMATGAAPVPPTWFIWTTGIMLSICLIACVIAAALEYLGDELS